MHDNIKDKKEMNPKAVHSSTERKEDTISGSEALMRSLLNEGVKTIFGYPGGAIMPVFDALYHYTRGENKKLNHVLVRHEQAAVHAAEGYSRVSGEVGVALQFYFA
jgi:acetolactate synthase-1/2/3 large subunit